MAEDSVVIRTYTGKNLEIATAAYQADAPQMAAKGYVPTSQTWAPGEYGCGSFIVALLLCFIIIGILVFFYMLTVKPDGTLTVTYELRSGSEIARYSSQRTNVAPGLDAQRQPCPYCAELILRAAIICRFCSRDLPEGWAGPPPVSAPVPAARNFAIGSQVRRTSAGPIGEIIGVDGEAITVRWPDDRTSMHLRRDLKPE